MLAHLQDPEPPAAEETVDVRRITYSPSEAAQVLGCSRQTIYELIRRGELTAHKVGALTKLRVAEVHALVGDAA